MPVNKITDLDHLGNGITKQDKLIIFIPKTIPGDTIEYIITKSHKKYAEGRITKLIDPSPQRTVYSCPYYNVCGGCNISNLTYQEQLTYKKNKVTNIFKRYLDISINPTIIASPKEVNYRNKITYHNDSKLGLVTIDNQIIEIENCLLTSDKVNELFRQIKKLDVALVKKIIIRECDNGLILNIDGQLNISNLKPMCIAIYQNNNLVYQQERPYLSIGNIKYFVSEDAFFQINTSNISKLYDQVIKYGEFTPQDQIIDLYCGVGSISLYVSKYVKKVLGIEIVSSAIEAAKENAINNNITNTTFLCGDVEYLIDKCHDYNKVIVDPPRSGLDKHTINILNRSQAERIIYVSCDPMTLARDLKLLDNYQLQDITLVDMFPQTHHVESVVLLHRKN